MTTEALIIFVRYPELGKVKTRLARDVGDRTALAIYERLLVHTKETALAVSAERFVFYEDRVHSGDIWPEAHFQKRSQVGETLGQRMFQAFSKVLEDGFNQVVIIGSDCLDLGPEMIIRAFETLAKGVELVLGPASDGGYYLLGMSSLIPEAFTEKAWSSETVLRDTLSDLSAASISVGLLPELSDIDTYSDLPGLLKSEFNI